MILFQYSNLLLFAIGDFDFSITAGEPNNTEIIRDTLNQNMKIIYEKGRMLRVSDTKHNDS